MIPILANTDASSDKLYVDDVFSTWLYTGNDSTQTITNGIDLSMYGGLVWIKSRGATARSHHLVDTSRGVTNYLRTNQTNAQATSAASVTAFNNNGFSIGSFVDINSSSDTNGIVSWTFRKAPKFFDVVTWTGNGDSSRQVAHGLGIKPGFLIIKRTDGTGDWWVAARDGNNTWVAASSSSTPFALNSTNAGVGGVSDASLWTSTYFYPYALNGSGTNGTNINGATYVAYLFAHDTGTDGMIQCGSFTVPGPGVNVDVNLGWEAQFVITKVTNQADNWAVGDVMRGMDQSAINRLMPNLSNAEDSITSYWTQPTATGFKAKGFSNGGTYIYLAIRRPNKPPTVGTQVYNAIARTGTGAAATVTGVGFAPDLVMGLNRSGAGGVKGFFDRLRGVNAVIRTTLTSAEDSTATDQVTAFGMDGVTLGADATFGCVNKAADYVLQFLRRAPGVFDVVCYTSASNGSASFNHNLGVVPELMITKDRTQVDYWMTYASGVNGGVSAANYTMDLASNRAQANAGATWLTLTASSVSIVAGMYLSATDNHVAYLFATKAGISKVGSYTGNGSSLTLNCGFTTGARFILIKRTDSTGDWFVWDSVRGIVAANDPHLSLNANVAEVTGDDSIDPDNSGIIVNQNATTNINVNGASYIFLSFS